MTRFNKYPGTTLSLLCYNRHIMKTFFPVLPTTHLTHLFRLTPTQKTALAKLRVTTALDLLYYFPARYSTIAEVKLVRDLKAGESAVVYGRVVSAKTAKAYRKKIPMTEAIIEDGTGRLKVVWFHQAYIAKMLEPDTMVKLSGRIEEHKGALYLANPEVERTKELPIDNASSLFGVATRGSDAQTFFYPVYPETRGITSRFLHHHVVRLFEYGILDKFVDPIPEEILTKYHLPTLKTALVWIHTPQSEPDARAARKRFAFEEVFMVQLARRKERMAALLHKGFVIDSTKSTTKDFIARFPFLPTDAQSRALADIFADMKKCSPMARLLEGDVGSGKTFVAATAAHAVVTTAPANNKHGALQVAYMAPTEILAEQHFKSFIEYFKKGAGENSGAPIEIGLLTGSGAKKFPSKTEAGDATSVSRRQLLKWVAEGKLPILIGTHALISRSVVFKDLALAIVDEQHRFGTRQRGSLARKDTVLPHFLSMTATPIPRTLALTIYGNLDLTLLDQMPAGRLPVKTEIVQKYNRKKMEDKIRAEILRGRQAYIICPRIDTPDPEKELALNAKSVKEEAVRLKTNIFPEFEITIMHGKMTPAEKEKVMSAFVQQKIHIMVATSVIEVGVDVPNATIIVIEGAERFGLASLHQLRGRVMRSSHQPYCYILTDTRSKQSLKRLRALATAKNGFELAELDLMLRGAGELSGGKQWGLSDLGMEAIKNLKMVEAARQEAHELLGNDPDLALHPILRASVDTGHKNTHWE
jgi:ATP-dependent DNA helicase RecG